jgi:DNA polymerase
MDTQTYKQQLLNELYEPYKHCLLCPLGSLGRKNVVFGQGNPNASLMFIGEGPGKQEDEQGLPFVGKSGKFLNQIFKDNQISRSNIFIINIVKCRPPNNRKPLLTESTKCKNLLLFQQIKIIRPTIICTLGSSATQALIKKCNPITKLRGKTIKNNDLIVLPTYHPAYVLRNKKVLKEFTKDIKNALHISNQAK